MVFRDYMVRCKRCKIPYIPDNVSRIRTCIFCRKSIELDKKKRMEMLIDNIKKYSETQLRDPTEEIVKTWIKFKFNLTEKEIIKYLNNIKKLKFINFVKKENNTFVVLNQLVKPINS